MIFVKALSASTLTAALLASTAASALTADDLWKEMQGAAQFAGLALQAGTIVEGERQTLYKDVALSAPGGFGKVTLTEVTLVEREDGSVTVYPGTFGIDEGAGAPANFSIDHDALTIDVAEDDKGRSYDIKAGRFDVQGLVQGGGSTSFTYQISDLAARLSAAETGYLLDARVGHYTAGSSNAVAGQGVEQISNQEGDDLQLMLGLTVPAGLTLASLENPKAFDEAVRKGLGLLVEGSGAAAWARVESKGGGADFAVNYKVDSTKISMILNADTAAIDVSATALSGDVSTPLLPEPVTFSVASLSEGVAVPVVAPTGGRMHVSAKIEDLDISEGAWSMFDPGQVITRGPINLDLDLKADVKMDLLEEMAADEEGRPSRTPPEVTAATISKLFLSFGGATLDGVGDFALKGAFLSPGAPPPTPIGSAEIKATGLNQLIDNLISIGLIPPDQESALRFGLAMIAKPGVNPEELVSSIEAKEDGQILFNGQRIK